MFHRLLEERDYMKKRLLSVLLILMLLFSLVPGTAAFAQTADGKPEEISVPAELQSCRLLQNQIQSR